LKRDRITAIGGEPVTEIASFMSAVAEMSPGENISLAFMRKDQLQSLELKLGVLPETVPGEVPTFSIPPIVRDDEDKSGPKVGRFTVELPAHQHSYWAYVPSDYNPDYPYGLMVWMHPTGDTMEAAVMRLWKSVCERRNLMIIAPKADNPRGWKPAESVFVKAAIEHFAEQYPIDRRRVFAHGYGSGGAFALSMVFKERGLFAGAAVASASLMSAPPPNSPDHRIQLHFNSGSADAAHQRVARTVEGLRKMKYPVSFSIAKDRSKKYPSQEDVREIGRWADSLDRI
jgi:serine protease Do